MQKIVEIVNETLNANGRSERLAVVDGHIYFEGFTVLEDWCGLDDAEAWVCWDHNNPNETACRNHPYFGWEKWSVNSAIKWTNFALMTLCYKEGTEITGDFRDEGAWDIPNSNGTACVWEIPN